VSHLNDFENFIVHQKRLSPLSVSAYMSDLSDWLKTGLNLEKKIHKEDLLKAIEKLSKKNLHKNTLFRKRIALRSYLKFRALTEESYSILAEELKTQYEDEFNPQALSVEELTQLCSFPTHDDSEALRDRAIIEMMYSAGLRASELLSLTWMDIDERLPSVRVLGKGQKERLLPLSARALYWLERYKNEKFPEWEDKLKKKYREKIFVSKRLKPLTRMALWKIFQRRSKQQGLDPVHPHQLRHSFATHLLQGGADVRFVQALLGHSKINTTERYLKFNDDDLRKMLNEFHPLEK
jgi:site-specific recombinase XerD